MNVEFNMLRSIKTEYNGGCTGYPTDGAVTVVDTNTGHSLADHHIYKY